MVGAPFRQINRPTPRHVQEIPNRKKTQQLLWYTTLTFEGKCHIANADEFRPPFGTRPHTNNR